MITPDHLRLHVIRPTLELLNDVKVNGKPIRNDSHVEDLILGTAAQETHCGFWLRQHPTGPGLGIYSMEEDTHESLWDNYLAFRPDLASAVRRFASQRFTDSNKLLNCELITNLAYATAMVRVYYLPVPEQIPETLEGKAEYWDKHYNKNDQHGTPADYLANWYRLVERG